MVSFKKPLSEEDILHWLSLITGKSILVKPQMNLEIIEDDPEDDKFLEVALEGNADYIISQDKHLLKLKKFRGIKIVKPDEFLKVI